MGIEKHLEAAARHMGYPEDGPAVQPLARDALSAINVLKAKLTRAETALAEALSRAEAAEADKRRLDFLDDCNAALNARQSMAACMKEPLSMPCAR